MTERDNGGPAFPVPEVRLPDGTGVVQGADGMTLRDWFAGQALAGLLASDRIGQMVDNAKDAYTIADAMLAERKREPKP